MPAGQKQLRKDLSQAKNRNSQGEKGDLGELFHLRAAEISSVRAPSSRICTRREDRFGQERSSPGGRWRREFACRRLEQMLTQGLQPERQWTGRQLEQKGQASPRLGVCRREKAAMPGGKRDFLSDRRGGRSRRCQDECGGGPPCSRPPAPTAGVLRALAP